MSIVVLRDEFNGRMFLVQSLDQKSFDTLTEGVQVLWGFECPQRGWVYEPISRGDGLEAHASKMGWNPIALYPQEVVFRKEVEDGLTFA